MKIEAPASISLKEFGLASFLYLASWDLWVVYLHFEGSAERFGAEERDKDLLVYVAVVCMYIHGV